MSMMIIGMMANIMLKMEIIAKKFKNLAKLLKLALKLSRPKNLE